mmetsp:Transcript_6673/g.16329  ORF Transcript_6673/g.16329 Transcript_6673/m.16329 type:complete len:190 (-) Transcript_6673:15-584(-)
MDASTQVVVRGDGTERRDDVPDDFQCAVCYQVFLDPVSLPCGHTFCASCFRRWLGRSLGPSRCPSCAEAVPATVPKTNVILRNILNREYPDLVAVRAAEEAEEEAEAEVQPTPPAEPAHEGLPQENLGNPAEIPQHILAHIRQVRGMTARGGLHSFQTVDAHVIGHFARQLRMDEATFRRRLDAMDMAR